MKGYTAAMPNGEAIHYVDNKRWWWWLSVLYPLQALGPMALHATSGNELWFVAPFVFNFVVLPILDHVIGEDSNNPPDEVLMQLETDTWYRWLTWIAVPVHFVVLFGCAAYAATQPLSAWAFTLLAVHAGMIGGLAVNTAHELGHKSSSVEKRLSRLTLAVPAYGHFVVEHNRGHHVWVSTPEDCASARMGESIFRFARREIPGAFRRAWAIELERLRARELPAWHYSNPILQSYALSLAIALVLTAALGWRVLPFLLLHHAAAYLFVTTANYIEHYGLLREQRADGRYERCQPQHSWNSNHILSNLVLFHLERHSDHHANPLRRYQTLRHFDDIPALPNGYLGMLVAAWIPPLWFHVMDERLLALPHIRGDLDKINVDPQAGPAIFLKWGRASMEEPTITDLPGP